ncbi:MAG: c-type cytochrome [Planctomycetes bacterium]|nr:c-type cytochrome [Planctomycetota bacterium]
MRKLSGASGVCLIVPVLLLVLSEGRPQGYAPEMAVRRMKVPDGFIAKLVAAEPLVRQPVAIDFDDRGRLWVIQYLQYPNPAGLKRVKVDRYSRTVYDRVPEPPPRGPKGADRITILEDTDGDGRADRAKDFVNGLNLTSGFAFGHGGVFVLQVPYLLFYPSRNGELADGDPEVLLKGFGMEDAHSVANSLTWGPDGWLYGCQGSTVTANVRGIEFQQGVWRYHPRTHKFELFCEGGGNSWGLDFDRHGNLLYSTNYGGFILLHGVQGGYYWKLFGKHGALHNPHAYGYFDHAPHRNPRGGHVTVGGIVYRGDSFPDRFRDKYIAADLLGHNVYWNDIEPWGSTFRTAHAGDLLLSNDTWFAPSDVALGPEGAVYVADWHDRRTAHPDPDADWDRSNGRVYKIEAKGTKPYSGQDLRKLSSEKLVALLSHRNDWLVRKARRLLADRHDRTVIPAVRSMALESKDEELALQGLWALYVSGGFDDDFAAKALSHRSPHVRSWTVRLLGDECKGSSSIGKRLRELAESDASVMVRSQLACTARRLPVADGLPIIERLLLRNEDGRDPYVPLLLWWAVEQHAVPGREQVLRFFTSSAAWKMPLVRDAIQGRLVRRYAAEGSAAGDDACARLLASAPAAERAKLLADVDLGLQERSGMKGDPRAVKVTAALAKELVALWQDDTTDATLLRLLMRLGRRAAEDRAIVLATDVRVSRATRLAMLDVLRDAGGTACIEPLLKLTTGREAEAVRSAALAALGRFDDERIASALLAAYPAMNERLRSRARDVLLGRHRWALAFVEGVERGTFAAKEVPVEQLRPLAAFKDEKLERLVRKHWGSILGGTPEEKLAEVRRLNNDLRAASGDPRKGRDLFRQHCANCHRLFNEGLPVGPDLTHANRKDRDYLLVSMVDPSAVIRREYLAYTVQTTDGRVLTGLIVEQTAGSITLAGAKNERTVIPRNRIEELHESPVSLMPEDLLKPLKPQEVRDLFAYLQADAPPRE